MHADHATSAGQAQADTTRLGATRSRLYLLRLKTFAVRRF